MKSNREIYGITKETMGLSGEKLPRMVFLKFKEAAEDYHKRAEADGCVEWVVEHFKYKLARMVIEAYIKSLGIRAKMLAESGDNA